MHTHTHTHTYTYTHASVHTHNVLTHMLRVCVRAHALKTHTLSYTYARAQWLSGHLSVFTPDGKEHFDLFDQECDSKLDYIIHVVTTIVNRDETDKNKEKPISSFKEYQTESSSGGLSGEGEGSGGGVGGGDGGKSSLARALAKRDQKSSSIRTRQRKK